MEKAAILTSTFDEESLTLCADCASCWKEENKGIHHTNGHSKHDEWEYEEVSNLEVAGCYCEFCGEEI